MVKYHRGFANIARILCPITRLCLPSYYGRKVSVQNGDEYNIDAAIEDIYQKTYY